MENIKKQRAGVRATFTKAATRLKAELVKPEVEITVISGYMATLSKYSNQLDRMDLEMQALLLEAEDGKIEEDMESAMSYTIQFECLKSQVTALENDLKSVNSSQGEQSFKPQHVYRKRLPKIELRKIANDPIEWLDFWSLFQKIHLDAEIPEEDKFQYLIQSTVEGSRAREIVCSYPPTANNYQKAIDSLQRRLGREEILVEVYVRELLKLVVACTQLQGKHYPLSRLYDKIETQLRALESLGVTSDKYAAMLLPLVESSLPEEILRAWQRASSQFQLTSEVNKEQYQSPTLLSQLMKFLRAEVEAEERIRMAMKGFGQSSSTSGSEKGLKVLTAKKTAETQVISNIPTAASLHTTSSSVPGKKQKGQESPEKTCIFCDQLHESRDCLKAQQMSVAQRKAMVMKSRVCFVCLRGRHTARFCRAAVKCVVCGRRHYPLLCEALVSSGAKNEKVGKDISLLSLRNRTTVVLQTLMIKLINDDKEVRARALIDTGSSRSYILKSSAERLGLSSIGRNNLIHSVFGGSEKMEEHNVYRLHTASLDGEYRCNFEVFDENVICSEVPSIPAGPWIDELANKGVLITDCQKGIRPIEVLIGADIAGKLLTGEKHELDGGLVAVETRLGWTMLGKVPDKRRGENAIVAALLSQTISYADVSTLWRLDDSGIEDSIERNLKDEHDRASLKHSEDTVRFTEEKRYETHLPWKEDHPPLGSQREDGFKRLHIITKKLKEEGLYDGYDQGFKEGLEKKFIEKVPEEELKNFKGLRNALSKVKWEQIDGFCTSERVKWKFSPPSGAWWGGWLERLNGLVKNLLRRVLGRAVLDYKELLTLLCDIESVINKRPLTYLFQKVEDLAPLSFLVFLQDIRESGVPDLYHIERVDLGRQFKHRVRLVEDLRKRFRTEYLGQLRERKARPDTPPIQVGDMVLVGDDNVKRSSWPLARVTQTLPGRDGRVRVVKLKMATGELIRPVRRFVKLEVDGEEQEILRGEVRYCHIIVSTGDQISPGGGCCDASDRTWIY